MTDCIDRKQVIYAPARDTSWAYETQQRIERYKNELKVIRAMLRHAGFTEMDIPLHSAYQRGDKVVGVFDHINSSHEDNMRWLHYWEGCSGGTNGTGTADPRSMICRWPVKADRETN